MYKCVMEQTEFTLLKSFTYNAINHTFYGRKLGPKERDTESSFVRWSGGWPFKMCSNQQSKSH
jgi:hypothetical protein